ncbi:MAG: CPBP family intramembrane glutamic endopeptidase [Bacteroidota bacterium]
MTCRICLALVTSLAFASAATAQPDAFGTDAYPGLPPNVRVTPIASIAIPLGGELAPRRLSTRQVAEMGAVVLTGVGHLVASSQDASGAYIPAVMAGWGSYVGVRALTEPGYLTDAGFTGENAGRAWRDATLVSLGAFGGMAVVGTAHGTLDTDGLLVPLLVLYPAWSLTQQFLVQRMLTRNLADAGLPPAVITPISAVTFGSVHVPNWDLTATTTFMGAAFTHLYQRDGNLWPLGVYHGALGAFAYVWVLDRGSWDEVLNGPENP